jgi:hypothetical protein
MNMSKLRIALGSLALTAVFLLICTLAVVQWPQFLAAGDTQLGAIATLIVMMTYSGTIRFSDGQPASPLPCLVRSMRREGFQVNEGRGRAKAAVNEYVRVVFSERNGKIRFRIEPTYNVWALFALSIVLTVIPLFGVVGFILVVYLFVRTSAFVANNVEKLKLSPDENVPLGIKDRIIDGLSEGSRIVNEALMDEESRHFDLALVLMFPAAIISIFSIIALTFLFGGPGLVNGLSAISLGVIIAVALILIPLRLAGGAYRKNIAELKDWSFRFQRAINSERKGVESEESSLDLMLQATEKMPVWLSMSKKSVMHNHPLIVFLIGILGLSSIRLLFYALEPMGDVLRSLSVIGAFALAVIAFIVYRMIERADQMEKDKFVSEWNERLIGARQRMEKVLEDL